MKTKQTKRIGPSMFMVRPLRLEYAGAVYHVMARGNQGRPIYADDLDRKMWLKTLGEACEKTGWRIHAYVLMGNHYHVLSERLRMGGRVRCLEWHTACEGRGRGRIGEVAQAAFEGGQRWSD
jgi:hypothetical protein